MNNQYVTIPPQVFLNKPISSRNCNENVRFVKAIGDVDGHVVLTDGFFF